MQKACNMDITSRRIIKPAFINHAYSPIFFMLYASIDTCHAQNILMERYAISYIRRKRTASVSHRTGMYGHERFYGAHDDSAPQLRRLHYALDRG